MGRVNTPGDNTPRPRRLQATESAGAASTPTGQRSLSKKQRRRAEQRKQVLAVVAIAVAVTLVVLAVLAFNAWRNKQIDTLPQDQRIVAVVGDNRVDVAPYSTCEIDAKQCQPSSPTELDFGPKGTVTLQLPQDVYDHDWSMLKIYDDPGANTEDYFRSNEQKEVTVSTASEKRTADGRTPKLTVVEIHSLLVGKDANGEQTPVATVWAIKPKG